METILIIVHVLVSLFLIVIVLLQHGKGADMGATFGGASNTVFGSEGPVSILNKITTGAAILFMITSISLAYISAHLGSGSVMKKVSAPVAPIESTMPLQRASDSNPTTIPMTEEGGQTDAAPAEFPGSKAPTDNQGGDKPTTK